MQAKKLEMEVIHFSPEDEKPSEELQEKLEQLSEEAWNGESLEYQIVTKVVVRDWLLTLLNEMDLWIPSSFSIQSDNRMDLHLSMDLKEIKEEVLRLKVDSEQEQLRIKQSLLDVLSSLGGADNGS